MDASVLLLSADGKRLMHGAAPNLSEAYVEAINGVEIGQGVGSCGTAAFTKERIVVSDIDTDPLWQDYKGLAEAAGLRACWSQPILQGDKVLGTFALYYHEPREPQQRDLDLIAEASNLAKVLIEKHQAKQSNDLSSRVFENSPMGILLVDDDGLIEYINPSMVQLVGMSREQLIGTSVKDLYREAVGQESLDLIRGDIRQHGFWQGEVAFRSRTGEVFYQQQVVSTMRQDDGGFRYIVTAIDVTQTRIASDELMEKERLLELALEAANINYWQINFEHMQFDLSRPEALFPLRKELAPAFYEEFYSKLHPDDYQVLERSFLSYLKGETRRHRCEYRILQDDGCYHWLQSTGKFVEFDKEGVPTLLIGFHQDFDEIKSLTNEMHLRVQQRTRDLELATEAAEVAAKSKSTFLANMSHEIRTRLNGIVGVTDLLRETPLNDMQQDYLNTVTFSANTLLSIINDILDISKINEGMMGLERVAFNFHDFVSALLASYQSQADTGVEFFSSIDGDVPTWLAGDPTRLHQILGNLLSNAFKFTSQGSVGFLVKVESSEASSTQLLFEVRDSGIGIAEKAQSKIFEKFEQADLSTTREYGGSGLGLSICKKLVDLYNGEIWVDSEPGVGSSFFVRLKLPVAEAPEKGNTQTMDSQGQIDARVLVAEDNPVNQKVIAAMLNKFGVDYDLAHNGEEALALVCDGRHYDIIFMDCEMPKMDGYESTRRIRQWEQDQQRPGVRICALTSHAMAEHRDQCLVAGMDDHLAKPVTLQSLRQVLVRSLASASS